MKFIGIDYGSKRIGLAISDENNRMAFPKMVFKNDGAAFESIVKFCKENSIGAVVLGESLDFKGEPNPIMKGILKLKEKIEKELGLETFLEPEFLTTKQASHIQGRNEKIDSSAAAIILQSFLDRKNKNIN